MQEDHVYDTSRENLRSQILVLVTLKDAELEIFEPFLKFKKLNEKNNIMYRSYTVDGYDQPVVVVMLGEMGTDTAADVASEAIREVDPVLVVLLGICGGIGKDVKLGDVVIADTVDHYLASSKVISSSTNGKKYDIVFSGSPYRVNEYIINFINNITKESNISKEWYKAWEITKKELSKDKGVLISLDECPKFLVGHFVSGNSVIASKEFSSILLERDRNILAVDMEAAGVMKPAHRLQKMALVIKGVSDYADERKESLDKTNGGIWRKYAMNNASTFFLSLLRDNWFQRKLRQQTRVVEELFTSDSFMLAAAEVVSQSRDVFIYAHTPGIILPSERDMTETRKKYFSMIHAKLSQDSDFRMNYLFSYDGFRRIITEYLIKDNTKALEEVRKMINVAINYDRLDIRYNESHSFLLSIVSGNNTISCIGLKERGKKISEGICVDSKEITKFLMSQYSSVFKEAKRVNSGFLDKVLNDVAGSD
ncbi:MAG: hypothetical protein ACP5US_12695 [Candidatus Kryptoniota bacterium]